MQLKAECETAMRSLPWVQNAVVRIVDTSTRIAATSEEVGALNTLTEVAHIIAVSSCKGGVGKSTIALNLALSLSRQGLRVGLLDADIYGPSLPVMAKPVSLVVKKSSINPKHILPLEFDHKYGGVDDSSDNQPKFPLKILSFGHVNPNSGAAGSGGKKAAVVRGPIASRIVTQLLLATEWGALDYLVSSI